MDKQYNSYNFEASFKNYLLAEKISPITLKNYMSDLRHFLGWMNQTTKINSHSQELFTKETVDAYLIYLKSMNFPHSSVNRRLSTIRKFSAFCISQGWMKENPAKHIGNIIAQDLTNEEVVRLYGQAHSTDETHSISEFLTVINS